MGRGAVVVQLGRGGRVDAAEAHVAGTHADIQGFFTVQVKALTVHFNHRRATDVDQAQFAALQEEINTVGLAQVIAERQGLGDRLDTAKHDAIDVAVGHGDLIGNKHLLNQEFTAQAGSIKLTGVVAMNALTSFHY